MDMRNTIQRSLVLEAVKELRCHATADEVYDAIMKIHPNISRGTVYRNLNLLSDTGEIHKVEMPSGADCYDHLCHEHYHARFSMWKWSLSRVWEGALRILMGLNL